MMNVGVAVAVATVVIADGAGVSGMQVSTCVVEQGVIAALA